jgi:putative membrane protein
MLFLWLKTFHLIFMVCWFAGIFYLPRLFVYHAMADDEATRAHLRIMERKLYRFTTPFAVLTVAFGLALVSLNSSYYFSAGWFHAKVFLVLLLIGYHLQCGRYMRQLQNESVQRSHVFYRWFNEAPVLVLFAAVILAVVKPF